MSGAHPSPYYARQRAALAAAEVKVRASLRTPPPGFEWRASVETSEPHEYPVRVSLVYGLAEIAP